MQKQRQNLKVSILLSFILLFISPYASPEGISFSKIVESPEGISFSKILDEKCTVKLKQQKSPNQTTKN